LGEERLESEGTNTRYSWLLAIVLLPSGLVGVLVQDLLSVAERFGVHLAWGDEIVVFERYHESRVMVELLLESLPQAIPDGTLRHRELEGDPHLHRPAHLRAVHRGFAL
jgi:hypothetical protein